ncbi:NAD(P)H-dependent glycerol-3-phosphate dehydrogenase [Endozoicomonadaceae bacterium StTr2]
MKSSRESTLTPCRMLVIGGGSFGTAIAEVAASNGHQVTLWLRDESQAVAINEQHENSRYLPGYALNPAIRATTDSEAAIEEADVIFVSVPSKAFRSVVKSLKLENRGKLLISCTKGIERDSFDLMSEILHQEASGNRIGVISGPNLAKEIVAGVPTATVVASEDHELCEEIQQLLTSESFRVYTNPDRYGVELGGALKNIYAIVAGMASSMGLGENTHSMLITRSLAEMGRFAVQMGANPLTFLGLAGVGDLIATCTSPLSRNFRVGLALGEGKSLEQAEEMLGQVAEGINTLRMVKQQADKMGIVMPIVSGLYEVAFKQRDAWLIARVMLMREQKTDVEFITQRDGKAEK